MSNETNDVIIWYQRGNQEKNKRRYQRVIRWYKREYRKGNHEIPKWNTSRQSKDSECNIQNFGYLKADIYNRKTNRVQSIQWHKEKKQTMICNALHKKKKIIQEQINRDELTPIRCHMLNCKTKQKYNDKSWLWYKVWLVADTNIVMEIIKQHVGTYFYFSYRKKNRQQRRQTVRKSDSVSYIGKLMSHVFKVSLLCDI